MDAAKKKTIKSEPCNDLHHTMPISSSLVMKTVFISCYYYLKNTNIISGKIMPFISLNY